MQAVAIVVVRVLPRNEFVLDRKVRLLRCGVLALGLKYLANTYIVGGSFRPNTYRAFTGAPFSLQERNVGSSIRLTTGDNTPVDYKLLAYVFSRSLQSL